MAALELPVCGARLPPAQPVASEARPVLTMAGPSVSINKGLQPRPPAQTGHGNAQLPEPRQGQPGTGPLPGTPLPGPHAPEPARTRRPALTGPSHQHQAGRLGTPETSPRPDPGREPLRPH